MLSGVDHGSGKKDTPTGNVYDVGGVPGSPKGIDPSAPLFAGCHTRSKGSTSYDHTAISRRTHAEVEEATCGRLNGVAGGRRGHGEEIKGLLGVWTVDMSYRGRQDEGEYLKTWMEAMTAMRVGNSSGTHLA